MVYDVTNIFTSQKRKNEEEEKTRAHFISLPLSLSYLLQQKRITSLHPLLPTPDSSS